MFPRVLGCKRRSDIKEHDITDVRVYKKEGTSTNINIEILHNLYINLRFVACNEIWVCM